MAIDTVDLAEVQTLSVAHPSQAPGLVGKTFVSPWFTMDTDHSELFHRATYMDAYLHPYPDDGYGEGLVEGYHLLGMLDVLLNHVLWSETPLVPWNYGLDRVRFVSVIRCSDRFRLRGTVTEVIDRGSQGWLLVADIVGEVEGRDRPGFIATQRVLWATPDSAASGPADASPAAR
jgi:acyl dehydratase